MPANTFAVAGALRRRLRAAFGGLNGVFLPLRPDHRRVGLLPVTGSKGSRIAGSSLSGLFTRVEIGHIIISSAGKGTSRSRGSGSTVDSQRS